jgi:NADH-quinone oxidoreductase subunit M
MILLGTFQRAWSDAPGSLGPQLMVIAVLAVSGVVLGAWYMLWMIKRVFFGPLKEGHISAAHASQIRDLQFHEILALSPLVVFIVWIGVYPQLFLKPIAPAAETILARTAQPLENYYAKRQVAAREITTPVDVSPKASLQTALVPQKTN